jgi:hypothetical protein
MVCADGGLLAGCAAGPSKLIALFTLLWVGSCWITYTHAAADGVSDTQVRLTHIQ